MALKRYVIVFDRSARESMLKNLQKKFIRLKFLIRWKVGWFAHNLRASAGVLGRDKFLWESPATAMINQIVPGQYMAKAVGS